MGVRLLLGALQRSVSSAAERRLHTASGGGSSPSLTTVAESKAAEEPACEAGKRGFESLRSPQASVAQRRLPQTVNLVSHPEVRVLPGAPGFR